LQQTLPTAHPLREKKQPSQRVKRPSATAALRHSAGHPFWGHAVHRPGTELVVEALKIGASTS